MPNQNEAKQDLEQLLSDPDAPKDEQAALIAAEEIAAHRAELEAKRAQREVRSMVYELRLEAERLRHREAHIQIVEAVLPREDAEKAIDALQAAGVVFARMGARDDG